MWLGILADEYETNAIAAGTNYSESVLPCNKQQSNMLLVGLGQEYGAPANLYPAHVQHKATESYRAEEE